MSTYRGQTPPIKIIYKFKNMTPEIKKLKKKVEQLEKRKEEIRIQLYLTRDNLKQAEEDFDNSKWFPK